MKVVIIGSGGFIGAYLHQNLKNYDIIPVAKETVNLFNLKDVTYFLELHKPEVVVNCLSFGINDTNKVDQTTVNKNLTVFNNFLLNSNKFNHYINIGSGSEFNTNRSIDSFKEEQIFNSFPTSSYGYSKNIISRTIFDNNSFTTLRLFGCFGSGENSQRLLKKYIHSDSLSITDRYFDYFSIQDFCSVVDHVIKYRITASDINCVYSEPKIKISDFLTVFDNVKNTPSKFVVDNISELNYTGCSRKLKSLDLNLKGLELSLKEYYD